VLQPELVSPADDSIDELVGSLETHGVEQFDDLRRRLGAQPLADREDEVEVRIGLRVLVADEKRDELHALLGFERAGRRGHRGARSGLRPGRFGRTRGIPHAEQ
jgi:hypothetical protein